MVRSKCLEYHPPERLQETCPTILESIYMPDPSSNSPDIAMFSKLAVQTKNQCN